MSETPVQAMNESERVALFATWLKPLTPVRQTRNTTVAKIAPWRKEFVAALKAGFSWTQLAKDVASKPDIGVKGTGRTLMNHVIEAYRQAGEPLDLGVGKRQRRAKRKHASDAPNAAPTVTIGS